MDSVRRIGLVSLLSILPASGFASPDHWIYDADVVLYDDYDSDGFYRFLSVRIDADTIRDSAWVYAKLYLSDDGKNWVRYHTTDDFLIGGQTGDDEIYVETELQSGYPTGYYDLLIELYDADLGTYSDEFGPEQSDGLALLALEDKTQDPEPVEVTVVDGGGGAFSWLLLPGLWLAGRRGLRARAARA